MGGTRKGEGEGAKDKDGNPQVYHTTSSVAQGPGAVRGKGGGSRYWQASLVRQQGPQFSLTDNNLIFNAQ